MGQHTPQSGVYLDGAWHESQSTAEVDVIDPTTEEQIASVPNATETDVNAAVESAVGAQSAWERQPARAREEAVRQIGTVLAEHADELAGLLAREHGKPRAAARAEIDLTVDLANYVAGWARRIEGEILPGESERESIHLLRKPRGVIGAILPWNYPLAIFVRKVAPALVTGNTVVAKPSEETPLSTLRFVELFDEHAELPDGALNVVTGDGSVGGALVESPSVDMIAMTGNVETGKTIMRQAAENLTEVSLELGGKAPAIVWHDADVEQAVDDLLLARMENTGQVCTAAERIYVHADVHDEFVDGYAQAAESLELGPPDADPDLGPQVSARECEKTRTAVETAVAQGATVETGGDAPSGEEFEAGYWFQPTVLTGVTQEMDVVHDEVFGPVSPILEVDDFEEVLEYANDSSYGLTSYIFTNDYELAMRAAEEIECGKTYVNRTLGDAWHAHHIGWGESGTGGEDGKHGVLKYTQLKAVYHNY
jgi:lactaldehyde dehydrogenase / glycolaldehyde dehydrogenase